MARIVIALGGNALGETPEKQKKAVKDTARSIANLIEEGHEVIITHGNGPQVGMINLAFEMSAGTNIPEMPFPECGAMSQGYIGYHLQNAITGEFNKRNLKSSISTIITRVVVDANDPAFANPSKPVGNFYNKEQADRLARTKGYNMKEDAGRGYRRVVPSPLPVDIEEKEIIKDLVDNKHIVVACGGGGIPVIKEGNSFKGISAVIDKDFASAKLAELLKADILLILTAVEKVALNYGTIQEKWLTEMNVKEAKRYCEEGHFAEGSMLPKIKAAIKFVLNNPKRKTIITSLANTEAAITGNNGTVIRK